jgi:hypothetical protein
MECGPSGGIERHLATLIALAVELKATAGDDERLDRY